MNTPMTPAGDDSGAPDGTRGGRPARLAVMTSGGDAQGMNAAVRAVVRTGIHLGAEVYAIHEGWQGAVDGGARIRRLGWDDVGSILHRGGTVIGTARSHDFRQREGQLRAAGNLVAHGIDRIVVIGGDGSLTGANEFRKNWSGLLAELVSRGQLTQDVADAHPAMMLVGLVGSIDNDLVGTDVTIGADSALHRIIEALDAISSTAASHQRTFVVEVMGRHCGYLPLMAAVAGGCDYALIPEDPPADGWQERMCQRLQAGRAAGRRDSLVLVAEGAADRHGHRITAADVKDMLTERLGEDTRVTILGHVQRGGAPSAYDRWMSTLLGYAAAQEVLAATPELEPVVLGVRHQRVARLPLVQAVADTRALAARLDAGDVEGALQARGGSFAPMVEIMRTLAAPPSASADPATAPAAVEHPQEQRPRRVGILHAGGLAPGMNTAARAAVRMGMHAGWSMLGIEGGFPGLIGEKVRDLGWSDVEGWVAEGGAELGTRRTMPSVDQLYAVARALERCDLDALLVIGGHDAYEAVHRMTLERTRYPAFGIPIVLVPATIDNNLPGTEVTIGADTALNNAVWALDRIKQSAAATTRCFVAETMGRRCGYLALMAGLASGAERVYLHEEGVTLAGLAADVEEMKAGFAAGRKLFLAIRNEEASQAYTTDFLVRLFEQEGADLFDVRPAVIGHLQQGGSPSPYDRLLANHLVWFAMQRLARAFAAGHTCRAEYVGMVEGELVAHPVDRMGDHVDTRHRRPRHQWWLQLRPVIAAVAQPHAPTGIGVPVLRETPQ